VGETELGASAVGGVLYFAFAMIGLSIGTGAQIMIARRSGEKNDSAVGEIFDHSFLILLTISVTLFTFLEFLSPIILRLILNSHELVNATVEFLRYRSYGLIFITTAAAFRSFYVGIAQPKIFGVYSFLMAAINMFLGYVLIFGNFGFEAMGIAGAGAASSIAEFLALIFIFVYTIRKKVIKNYNLFYFKDMSRAMVMKIMNLSLPLVIQNLLSMGSWFIFFVFIEKFGQHELAISNIVRATYMISMTPVWGFSVAANSMVSNIIGQKREGEVFQLLNRIMKLTVLIALVMIGINLLIPSQILSLFTSDATLINDAKGSLYVVDFAMLFFAFAIISISAVSGTGATRIALYIEIAAIIIYMIYNYIFTFVFPLSVEILWMSEVIYWLFTGADSYWYIGSLRWMKYKV
jgi:putative MATE family efflux protein